MSDAAFIRWVPDLAGRLSHGADPEFYDPSDEGYLPILPSMADRVNQACLAAGIGTAPLHQHGASSGEEEPSTLFVINLGQAAGRREWKVLVARLSGFISADVWEAAQTLEAADAMKRIHDDAFDTLEGCAALRNGLLRIGGKKQTKTSGLLLSV